MVMHDGLRGEGGCAARDAQEIGMPAAGLLPRPGKRKDFLLISFLSRVIHFLSLHRED
jgi:hypothetical protein